jgi:hypothetical protein
VGMRSRQEMSLEDLEATRTQCALEISDTEEKIRRLHECESASELPVGFTKLQTVDFANVWEIAEPKQRQPAQNLLFRNGLSNFRKPCDLNRSDSSLCFKYS